MTGRDRFWELVYDGRRYIQLLLFFLLFLLILSSIALLFGQSSAASAVMLKFDFTLIFLIGGVAVSLYWYSTKRHAEL